MTSLVINGRFLAQKTTGVQRVAREITREIDALVVEGGHDVDVRLVCQPHARLDDLDLRAIRVQTVAGFGGHLWEQLTLPTVVGDAPLLCLGNSAPVSALLSRRPVGVVVHDLSYRLYPGAYRPMYRLGHGLLMPLLLRRARPLITVSESERRQLHALADGRDAPILVAPNGAWRSAPTRPLSDGERAALPDPGFLLYTGALSQRKNTHGLFEAAIRLAREDGRRFVFAGGSASIHTHIDLQVPADLRDRILFLGQIEDDAVLAELYARADCLVFPSFYEASPLPPVEAMHFGCPVVAADIPSLRERCGDAAEYCDPGEVAAIVAAVRRVVNDPARRHALIDRGAKRAAAFTWRRQAELILASMAGTR